MALGLPAAVETAVALALLPTTPAKTRPITRLFACVGVCGTAKARPSMMAGFWDMKFCKSVSFVKLKDIPFSHPASVRKVDHLAVACAHFPILK
jgi:hypothetical protein